jgi:MFS family permease
MSTPQMAALIAASLVGRMPIGIQSLALVLFIEGRTGSFATAGAVTASYALAGAVSSPPKGRLVDRLGQTRVLVPSALLHVAACVALAVLVLGGASIAVAYVFAALAGLTIPPVWACLRPLIQRLVTDEALLPAAFAVDALMIETVFVVGPLLTAGLVAAFSPAVAVVASGVFAAAGTLWFAAMPASREWSSDGVARGVGGALATAGMRTLLVISLPIGLCFGTLEVALPAFADEQGSASVAGILFAGLSVGSAAGGLIYGARPERFGSVLRAYLILAAALPLCFALLIVPSSVALMLALVPLAGCVLAPLTAAESQLIATAAPRGAATEAITWIIMATVLGAAMGNAAAGAIVHSSGWRPALLAGCAVMAVGAAVALARRHTLVPPARVAVDPA